MFNPKMPPPLASWGAQTSAPPTAVDAFAMLEADANLTPTQRRDRLSALTAVVRICRPVDDGNPLPADIRRDAHLVPMTCAFLRERLYRRPPKAFGFRDKRTFENVVSQLRQILCDLGQHAPRLPFARELSPGWQALHARLTSDRQLGLTAFMAWCSVQAIAPEAVGPDTLDAFETWLVERTLERQPYKRARRTASTWNWASKNGLGWPSVRLTRPNMSDHYALPWEAYPASLQADAQSFIDLLAKANDDDPLEAAFDEAGPGRTGRSLRYALRPRTLQTRRDCLKVAAAALVASGIPPESLTSLRDLVDPVARAQTIIAFHRRRTWERLVARSGGDEEAQIRLQDVASSNLFNIAETLRQVARYHCDLPAPQVARIAGWARAVTLRRQLSMSEKNSQRLSALVQPRNYALLLHLPAKLMQEAVRLAETPRTLSSLREPGSVAKRNQHTEAPARLVMHAVALEILTVCPVRRSNLAKLRLDQHLLRTRPGAPIHEIYVPSDEVKNSEPVAVPISPETAQVIETYLRDYRPRLAQPGNPFLFPGSGQQARRAQDLSVALKQIVGQELGVEFNLQLMRHFAVHHFLRAFPGHYEIVRQLLGHRSVATTRAFYAGLEARFAARKLDDLVRDARRDTRLSTAGSVTIRRKPGKKRPGTTPPDGNGPDGEGS
ncbi:MAG: site-specific integrase [Acidobacteria bacterium]|nr:site-specific integrase [Acidobacteriota bacterium]